MLLVWDTGHDHAPGYSPALSRREQRNKKAPMFSTLFRYI
jgi:hypothetical protein